METNTFMTVESGTNTHYRVNGELLRETTAMDAYFATFDRLGD